MKKQMIPALIAQTLSLVIAVGSQTFFGACAHEEGSFGACHWAGKAILGEGALLAALSALAIALKRERAGLYLAMLPASLLGLLTPDKLIALCKGATMRCRMLMLPAASVLFGLTLVAALTGWLITRKGE